MRYFGFGLLGFGILEVMSVFWMAGRIGGGMTFVLMVLSAMAGVFMLRRMGLSGVLLAASAARGGGKVSAYQMLWPVRYAVAGLLLLSPGFVSTAAAVLLMLPFKGGRAAEMAQEHMSFTAYSSGMRGGRSRDGDDVIEGEYSTVDGNGRPSEKLLPEDKPPR